MGDHPRIRRHGAIGKIFHENEKARYQRGPVSKLPPGVVKFFPARSVAMVHEIVSGCEIVTAKLATVSTISHKSSITVLNLCDEMTLTKSY